MASAQRGQQSRLIGHVWHDKWRIDARIARGGMGTVFAATHKNNGSTAAIKILHPEFSRDEDIRSRFLQEGYAANRVNHPGVVRILDDDVSEEGLAYLVMELLEGELLEQRRIRKGGKLPLADVYEIADQLLDVLAAAHANGIVHRDVKPDNIFLTRAGRLKVLDFGFAQMKTGFRREQTVTGFLIGTPGFMAPEQATGNRPLIDAQTDLWAVGATLFILLSGQPVHEGDSAAEILAAAANVPVRSIATLEPGLPTKLMTVVDRALAFDKRDRWPDARTMQLALRNVPGRQLVPEPVAGRATWGRSLPDSQERVPPLDAATGDATQGEWIEELDDEFLRTGTGETVAVHPADREEPTIEVGDGPTLVAISPSSAEQATPPPWSQRERLDASIAHGETEPHDRTMIMQGRPQRPDGVPPSRFPVRSHAPGPPTFGGEAPRAPFAGDDRMFVAAPVEAPKKGSSRVLVLVVVAGVTMIVVILTGLLVIVGLD